jgi:hypothetical protein
LWAVFGDVLISMGICLWSAVCQRDTMAKTSSAGYLEVFCCCVAIAIEGLDGARGWERAKRVNWQSRHALDRLRLTRLLGYHFNHVSFPSLAPFLTIDTKSPERPAAATLCSPPLHCTDFSALATSLTIALYAEDARPRQGSLTLLDNGRSSGPHENNGLGGPNSAEFEQIGWTSMRQSVSGLLKHE